jgi:hypothetical protein
MRAWRPLGMKEGNRSEKRRGKLVGNVVSRIDSFLGETCERGTRDLGNPACVSAGLFVHR